MKSNKLGFLILVISLVFYFLMELPFLLSVRCGNVNEGYYFGYGHHFLEGSHLYSEIYAARGPLFIMLYALVLKIFGINGWAIIGVHCIHFLAVTLIGIAIFITSKQLLKDSLYASLATLFWVLIQLSPIGGWGLKLEYESSFSLEAEYFCVLFSLISLYLLSKQNIITSLISGSLAACSMLFKGSGAILIIAILCWGIYLFIFQREFYKIAKSHLFYTFTGFFFTLGLALLALYIHNGELSSFFNEYYSLGYYSTETTKSTQFFINTFYVFLVRNIYSLNNLILYLLAIVIFIWGIFKEKNPLFKLICIWGVGNICAVCAPGKYASYYYVLVYPSVAISLIYAVKHLIERVNLFNKTFVRLCLVLFISLFFIFRLSKTIPEYISMAKNEIKFNFIYQPESFQDPVISFNNPRRPQFLKIADKINSYLPDKKDTFYIFNFIFGHQDFSPFIYIYAKRLPSSTVYSDWLYVENLTNKSMEMLIRDLMKKPPKILIVPENVLIPKKQSKSLKPFFLVLNLYIKQRYHTLEYLDYEYSTHEKPNSLIIFERNNS